MNLVKLYRHNNIHNPNESTLSRRATGLSYTTHREPVREIGRINPDSFSRGIRGISGTIKFNTEGIRIDHFIKEYVDRNTMIRKFHFNDRDLYLHRFEVVSHHLELSHTWTVTFVCTEIQIEHINSPIMEG